MRRYVFSVQGPAIVPIYGRDELTNKLFQELQKPRSSRQFVEGPSGIGKTALLVHVRNELRAQRPDQPALYQEVASGANSVDVVLGFLAADLIKQLTLPAGGLERLREKLNAFAWNNATRLSLALLLDGAKRVVPELTATVEALSSVGHDTAAGSSHAAIAERIAKKGMGDSLMGFLALLRGLSGAELSGTLVIDRVEAASPEVREVIRTIAVEPLGDWNVVLSVNNETEAGIHAKDYLWPDLAYSEFERLVVPPLDEADLAEWLRKEERAVPEVTELTRIVKYCDGRPLFLRDWVAGLEAESVGQSLIDRLTPYYLRRVGRLSAEANRVLTTLAILPTRAGVLFGFVQQLLPERTAVQVNATIDELVSSNFLEAGGPPYRVVHETTAVVLAEALPKEVVRECAEVALKAVSETTLVGEISDLASVRTHLARLSGDDALVAELGVRAGNHLLSFGSLTAAAESFDAAAEAATRIGSDAALQDARFGLAHILLHTGSYSRALVELEVLPETGRVLLLRSRVLIRLNRYSEAQTALRRLLETEADSLEFSHLLAEKERNTILRDLGQHERAASQSDDLVASARAIPDLPGGILASCLRAGARSQALVGNTDRSMSLGEEALRLGEELGSSKDIGSAILARAEALRHGSRYPEAVDAYEQSLRIGVETLNRDLELWAALGQANSAALDGRLEVAQRILDLHTKPIVSDARDRHPLEHLHWRLSNLVLKVLNRGTDVPEDAEAIALDYEALGIEWPRDYLANLIETGQMEPTPF